MDIDTSAFFSTTGAPIVVTSKVRVASAALPSPTVQTTVAANIDNVSTHVSAYVACTEGVPITFGGEFDLSAGSSPAASTFNLQIQEMQTH